MPTMASISYSFSVLAMMRSMLESSIYPLVTITVPDRLLFRRSVRCSFNFTAAPWPVMHRHRIAFFLASACSLVPVSFILSSSSAISFRDSSVHMVLRTASTTIMVSVRDSTRTRIPVSSRIFWPTFRRDPMSASTMQPFPWFTRLAISTVFSAIWAGVSHRFISTPTACSVPMMALATWAIALATGPWDTTSTAILPSWAMSFFLNFLKYMARNAFSSSGRVR